MKESMRSEIDNEVIREMDTDDGDRELEQGDISAAYVYYVRAANTERLEKIAKILEGKGRAEEAKNVRKEIKRIKELDK